MIKKFNAIIEDFKKTKKVFIYIFQKLSFIPNGPLSTEDIMKYVKFTPDNLPENRKYAICSILGKFGFVFRHPGLYFGYLLNG